MKDWMKIIPAEELKAYEKGGFMGAADIGERTALVVVDMQNAFMMEGVAHSPCQDAIEIVERAVA